MDINYIIVVLYAWRLFQYK